jgi:hypothetical protein
MDFAKIAPYLQDPLVLIGFVLLLFFGFGRAILKAGVIPVLDQGGGYLILSRVLLYGFVLAFAIVALGFGLKYRELSEREQKAAVGLLNKELVGDIEVAGELERNTATILNAAGTVSTVLRHPGISLLPALFPAENVDADARLPASLDLARQRLDQAAANGLLDSPDELAKFRQAGIAVSGTIDRTLATIESLADIDRTRYVISDAAWEANLPILSKVNIVDASQMQSLYQDMMRLRTNYGVVVAYCLDYLKAVRKFFSTPGDPITAQKLSEVLAAERLFLTTAIAYSHSVEEKVRAVDVSRKSLARVLGGDTIAIDNASPRDQKQ